MPIRRITLSDIAIGQPLPWDVYSTPSAPRPFLPKGKVVDEGELDGWLASGLYADAGEPVSVLQSLNHLNARLERTLLSLREHAGPDADDDLRAISRELIATVARAPDIALAAIFLNQIAGTYGVRHCTEAAIIVSLVGRALAKSAEEMVILTAATLTMNVGMVRQSALFDNRAGALSSEERATLRNHPQGGVDMLRWAGITDEHWLELVLLHHENDDGSGYPEGRLGDQISQNAKLIGLADRYCAFVSARNYRCSLLPPEALARLSVDVAMPVDPALVAQFGEQVGAYPPGTLVSLNNGSTAVVSARRGPDGGLPLHVLRSAQGNALPAPEPRSSADDGHGIEQALHEEQARVRFSMKQVWGELASL